MSEKAAEVAEQLRKRLSGPMTEEEIAFLKDAQQFIDFAIRNGLTFTSAAVLLQDLNELARAGWDYAHARARGFVPQVAKYARLTDDMFGSDDEEEEADS